MTRRLCGLVLCISSLALPAAGQNTPTRFGNVRICNQFSGLDAGAKIAACIDDLPPSGGTADARGIEGLQSMSRTIRVTKPTTLLLCGITLNNTAAPGFSIQSAFTLKGCSPGGWSNASITATTQATVIQNRSRTGNVIEITPPPGNNKGVAGVVLEDFAIVGNRDLPEASRGSGIVLGPAIQANDQFIRNVSINRVFIRSNIEHGIKLDGNVFLLELNALQSTHNVLDGLYAIGTGIGTITIIHPTFEFNRDGIGVASDSITTDIEIYGGSISANTNGVNAGSGFVRITGTHLENNTDRGAYAHGTGALFVFQSTISHGANIGIEFAANTAFGQTPEIAGNVFGGTGTSILIARGLNPINIWPQGLVGTIVDNSSNAYRYDQWNTTGGRLWIPQGQTLGWSDLNLHRASANLMTLSSGDFRSRRFFPTNGTPLSAGDFSLSPAWGNNATVDAVRGTDQAFSFRVNSAGRQQGMNPTITLNFKDGTWGAIPIVVVQRSGGSQLTVPNPVISSPTRIIVTFNGTPIAGETYSFNVVVFP